MAWAVSHADESDAALLLAGELGELWYQQGHGLEIRQWLHRALLQIEGPADPRARLIALAAAVGIAGFEGDYATAKRYCDELERTSRTIEDRFYLATALNEQGKLAQYHRGDNREAGNFFREAHEIFAGLPGCDRETNSIGLSLGLLASSLGHYTEAITYFRNTIEYARLASDAETLGYAQACLASTLADACKFEEADEVYREALPASERRGLRTLCVNLTVLSSRMALDRGMTDAGLAGYEAALKLSMETQDRHREHLSRIGISRACAEKGDAVRAREELSVCWSNFPSDQDDQLRVDLLFAGSVLAHCEGRHQVSATALGTAMAVRETIAWVIPPAEMKRWEDLAVRLRKALTPASVEAFVQAGRNLPDKAVASLLFEVPPGS